MDETTIRTEATGDPGGDETRETPGYDTRGTESMSGAGDRPPDNGREWIAQLQSMIDNIATQAGPVVRDVAAKAAELAALAGEKAGPLAQRAAEVTAQAGSKVAERGREVAAELRRDAQAKREAMGGAEGTTEASAEDANTGPATAASGNPSDDPMGRPGSPDSLGQ